MCIRDSRRVFFYTLNSLMFVLGSAVIYALPVMVGGFKGAGLAPVWAWRWALAIFAVIGAACALIPSFLINERDYVVGKSCYMPLLQLSLIHISRLLMPGPPCKNSSTGFASFSPRMWIFCARPPRGTLRISSIS